MIVSLSEAASNAMLDVLASMMNGGSIELHSDNGTLAILKLSNPAAEEAAGGELVFNRIAEEDAALATGVAVSGRVVGADGSEIFSCDVGDENSSATIKLTPQRIHRGAPVRINSFRLMVPRAGDN